MTMPVATREMLEQRQKMLMGEIEKVATSSAEAQAENDKLKAFARIVIEWALDGHDIEALDLQDVAQRNGLLVPHEATEDDVAAGIDCEVGDEIYRFADWMAE
jgi:hypothetical protein